MLTDLGILLAVGATALVFGRSILRSEQQMEAALMDPHCGLYNKTGLFVHGNELLQDCLRNDRAMTMVLLNCHDLGGVRDLLGRAAASKLFSEAVRAVARTAPRAGLAARTDRLEFVVVLPGLTNARSKEMVQSVLGTPPKLELKAVGRQVSIMMDVTVGSLGHGIKTMEELYELLQAKLQHRRTPPRQAHEAGESLLSESGGPLSRLELSPTLPMPLG
jgi:GGDEF domain-containing protein